jgi:vancomycin resistance protein YoaR
MAAHRTRRRTQWMRDAWSGRVVWTARRDSSDLPVRLEQHGSLLLRELAPGQTHLQHNKVTNLRLAAGRTDGLVIAPGETFSFNKVVGNCTRRKGYLDGMKLSNGSADAGVGGGICQLANLVHWMVLHSRLTVVERSEHSFLVEARDEQFVRDEGRIFRRNQIWRRVIDPRTGEQLGEELVRRNCALVVYEPGPRVDVIDLDARPGVTG